MTTCMYYSLIRKKNGFIILYKVFMMMSVKLIYVLSSFHMLFLSILYSYSYKNHNISSKLGFVGLLMESK